MALFPLKDFIAQIKRHEGDRLDIYQDSLGIWTVGHGFNMQQPGVREVCMRCGIDYDSVMALKGTKQPVITEDQAVMLTATHLAGLFAQVRKALPNFDSYSCARQCALLDVAWVGIGTFLAFHNMLAAVREENWELAAAELLNSKLAVQWGHRAQEDAEALRKG